jgi:hypothetical protein
MPIEFTHLHNLIRTYQRSLNLNDSQSRTEPRSHVATTDRVSISAEAREPRESTDLEDGSPPDELS